jgi:hypothetical protein
MEDIGNLRSVRAVWKNAQRFDRSSYRSRLPAGRETEAAAARASGPATAQQALEYWLALWRRYDLDQVGEVFLHDPSLTYYSADEDGMKEGFDAVLEYHSQQGFVPGGFRPENELWLENALLADFDDSAVVTAEWRFGNRVTRDDAVGGPLTMVIVRTDAGFRIAHLSMGRQAIARPPGN